MHRPNGPCSLIHRSAQRDCMKKGCRVVVRYSSRYEKTLPNGSLRCRMELHRASYAASLRTRSTANPPSPRDPRCDLLRLEKRLSVASTSPRLSSMAHRLPLLQKMAYRWHLGEDQSSSLRERLRVRLKRDPQPSSSAGIVDSQSVKTTGVVGAQQRGIE